MKAVLMQRYGKSNDVLTLGEVAEPTPGPDEVLIEVVAAGLNPVDLKIRDGQFRPLLRYRLPLVIGNELSGVVVGKGEQVTRFQVGDEVFARVPGDKLGAFAQRCVLRERDVCLKPRGLSFEEAASLPLVGLTVHQALLGVADMKPGQKVFIKAGSGGIGTFAIQFAKALGAQVTTTTSTANVEWVKKLGADQVLDYTKEPFEKTLSGFDIALDSVDGSVTRTFDILKPGGHLIALVGPPDAKFGKAFGLNAFMQLGLWLMSIRETRRAAAAKVHYSFFIVVPSGEQLAEIAAMVEQGKIKPVVDKVFPLDQFKEALDYLARGRTKGKVVLRVKA